MTATLPYLFPPQCYQPVYLLAVVMMTGWLMREYAGEGERLKYRLDLRCQSWQLIGAVAILSLFLGFRPLTPDFGDSMFYVRVYEEFKGGVFCFRWTRTNVFYDNLLHVVICYEWGMKSLYFTISAFYFIFIAVACRKLFPRDYFYAFVVYLGAFSTYTYCVNGFKAGAAAAAFLCALAYWRKWWILIPCLVLSFGWHHSMVMPGCVFVVCLFFHRPKFFFVVWVLCVVFSVFGLQEIQHFLVDYTDEQGVKYLTNWKNGIDMGFRPDFIIYSAIPILLGFYVKVYRGYESRTYDFLLSTYMAINSVWLLVMYSSCTNRIAYLSWLMFPIVLVYPFFDKGFTTRQFDKLNLVALGQLAFTVLMDLRDIIRYN